MSKQNVTIAEAPASLSGGTSSSPIKQLGSKIAPRKGHSRSRSYDASSFNSIVSNQQATISASASTGSPATDQTHAVKATLFSKRFLHHRTGSVSSTPVIEEPAGSPTLGSEEDRPKSGVINRTTSFLKKKSSRMAPSSPSTNPSSTPASGEESGGDEDASNSSFLLSGVRSGLKAVTKVKNKSVALAQGVSTLATTLASGSTETTTLPTVELEPADPLPEAPQMPCGEEMPVRERLRNKVINEILNTERDFVLDLLFFSKNFREPLLKQQVLTVKESGALFSNINLLLGVNKQLLLRLEEQVKTGNPMIGEEFLAIADYLKMYSVYCNNQHTAGEMKKQLTETHVNFQRWLLQRFASFDLGMLSLNSYLIKPIQRICKYPLLLRELLKYTDADHPDFTNLEAAHARIELVVGSVNQSTIVHADITKLAQLQARFHEGDKLGLMIPTRRFNKESVFREIDEERNVLRNFHYFLFNDLIIKASLSKRYIDSILAGQGANLKVKAMLPMSRVHTANVEAHPLFETPVVAQCAFAILYGDSRSIVVAESVEDKEHWISYIEKNRCSLQKQKTQPAPVQQEEPTIPVSSESKSPNPRRLGSAQGSASSPSVTGDATAQRWEELRKKAMQMQLDLSSVNQEEPPIASPTPASPTVSNARAGQLAPLAPSAQSPREEAADTSQQPHSSVALSAVELPLMTPLSKVAKPLRICIRLDTESDDDFRNLYLQAKCFSVLKEQIASKFGKSVGDIKSLFLATALTPSELTEAGVQKLECDDELIVTFR